MNKQLKELDDYAYSKAKELLKQIRVFQKEKELDVEEKHTMELLMASYDAYASVHNKILGMK